MSKVEVKKKIIFLAPYPPGRIGSQRFRFEQYWDIFKENFIIRFESFFSDKAMDILYEKGKLLPKIFFVMAGFANRLFLLLTISKYDYVFIHRETTPLGPPIFEWIIAKVLRKKIVYDFDDAIWLSTISRENMVVSFAKCSWKVKYICKWSWKISCGNEFLAQFALQNNHNVIIVPTTLDTSLLYHVKKERSSPPVLGWTGSHSTLKYLTIILPFLKDLEQSLDFKFVVIANKDPFLPLKNYQFVKWQKESEWQELSQIDIGLMPLDNTEWEEGKCGFKALEYMSIGIPALVSPTGANKCIIAHGENGFICSSAQDWLNAVTNLINNTILYQKIGQNGRSTVEEKYSKNAWQNVYQALFREEA